MKGKIRMKFGSAGYEPHIEWNDGREEKLGVGDVITLEDGIRYRVMIDYDGQYILANEKCYPEGLVCISDDEVISRN